MLNILLTLTMLIFCGSVILVEDNGSSVIVTVLFIILMSQSLYYLNFRGGANFSCYKVYFIFSFIFMAFTPYLHFSAGKMFWGAAQPDTFYYIITLILIIAFNLILSITYNYQLNINSYKKYNFNNVGNHSFRSKYILSILFIVTLITMYHISTKTGNIISIFIRVRNDIAAVEWTQSNQPIKLIVNRLIMFLPFFGLLFVSKYCKDTVIKLLILMMLLVCAFPLVISRYAVAAIYLPLLFFYFPNLLNGRKMQYVLIFSICTIFPFLEQFRRFEIGQKIELLPSIEFFYQPHFDAFQNLLMSISSGFITYGNQLLGSVFFFIPRLIWQNKPIGSGAQLAENLNLNFTNISMPLIAEVYINFGILGLFILPMVLGVILRKLDVLFWNYSYKESDYDILYIYLIGFFTFILRGDLLSSWAYFCAGAFSYILILVIGKMRK